MNSVFKLLIAAIVAIVLLYIFFTYFAPYYLWPHDPVAAIKQQLIKAELDLGKSQMIPFLFNADFATNASVFESKARSIAFNCNDSANCCDKGLSGKGCSNKIVWDERKVIFDKTINTKITARCFEEELAVCKVFIGKEPAQLEADSNYENLLDLSKSNKFTAKITIKNIGKLGTQDIKISGSLFKKNDDGSKELVDEQSGLMMPLLANDLNYFEVNFQPKKSGEYFAFFHIYDASDLTDFSDVNLEFEAINATVVSACKITEQIAEFDIVSEQCETKYLCENCTFAFECKEAWEKNAGKSLTSGDRTFAYELLGVVEGCMPEDSKVDASILENTATVDQAQDVFNSISINSLSTNGEKITKVALELQKRYDALPYIWGGKQLPPGVDCSGFVYNVFKIVGISNKVENALGYSSHSGIVVFDKENFYNKSAPNKYVSGVLQPGDVLFFDLSERVGRGVKGIDHVAIYIGNEQLVHSGTGGIKIKPLKNYVKSLMVARRY
ncbi:MAG: C40 family peptidase [archaeon]